MNKYITKAINNSSPWGRLCGALFAMTFVMPAMADTNDELTTTNEFATEETYKEGFLTKYLNEAIASGMESAADNEEQEYGRKVTKFASAPKFGGYFMSGYYYDSRVYQKMPDGTEKPIHHGDGFKVKNVRAYVSGTILKDFSYLMQIQMTNDKFHMKDYWLEWKKYKEFSVKAGQFIRVFGYECPYNPFEYHDGAYAQLSAKLCAQADRIGYDNGGGRDQGIQVQGDLFPVGNDKHSLLHYQVMVSNGQTINSGDANSQKDVSGCIAIQPVSGLRFAVWGWTGNFTLATANANGVKDVTVGRNRYLLSVFYDKDDWTFRTEYAHSTGHKVDDCQADGSWTGTGKAQGWYATVGIPCTPWLKTWLKYDAYQDDGTKASTRTVWSVAPHIALHKNLWFQPRLAYVNDKTLVNNKNYVELSLETAVRF